MTELRRFSPVIRDAAALLFALCSAGIVHFVLVRIGLVVAGASPNPTDTIAAFAVTLFFLVPATAGAILGAFAAHPIRLAIAFVGLSLAITYFRLGAPGMPHGSKLFEYFLQVAMIAGVATVVASYKRRAAALTSTR